MRNCACAPLRGQNGILAAQVSAHHALKMFQNSCALSSAVRKCVVQFKDVEMCYNHNCELSNEVLASPHYSTLSTFILPTLAIKVV